MRKTLHYLLKHIAHLVQAAVWTAGLDDRLTDRQTYEVIAVFKTVVYTDSPDSFKYYQFVNAETAEDFTAYVEKCKELSLYDTDVTAEYGDKLLTLSTCEYSRTNGRLVVVAKLINE